MVPVLDQHKKPLFPCKERRARCLIQRGEAKPYWQKGIFCIILTRKETEKREEYPDIALGIDPGSKREGYTAACKKGVVFNITSNTPDWVKKHMETRKNLRRSRRFRKTPYRKCRSNRSSLKNKGAPPSTKARWDAKLRVAKQLLKIIPITIVNVEDIKAVSKSGKRSWNKSFSPLEVGKKYFYSEVKNLGVKLIKTSGYATCVARIARGFEKSEKKHKLDDVWEAHNSDSHILCELALNKEVNPYKGFYKLSFLQFHRRQLHIQNPIKNNIRKLYGSTVSLGMSRGSCVKYKDKFYYLGGSSKGKVSLHSIITGKRVKLIINAGDIKVMHITKQRVQFIPRLKLNVSLHNLS